MILDKFPAAAEFYQTYWGRKPFVVRGAVDPALFEQLIDGDSLAGLALEEEIKSRIVLTGPGGDQWQCEHGPFEEARFGTLGEQNWSLLVQNVEQYHTDTAALLRALPFAPRWLMDDIMVSFSAPGGTVGPHTDSYHVFLVQGSGARRWKIGSAPVENEEWIEGLDLKVLKDDFAGEEVEVTIGDVIYIPPHFAHQGTTSAAALTFSVGFLGPKLSELLIEYGLYLEQLDHQDRYSGEGLNEDSAGFMIADDAQDAICAQMTGALEGDDFSAWLAGYFSAPGHDEGEGFYEREEKLSTEQITAQLKAGQRLIRAEHVKIVTTRTAAGHYQLAVYGALMPSAPAHDELIAHLGDGGALSWQDFERLGSPGALIGLVTDLYNQSVLYFEEPDSEQ